MPPRAGDGGCLEGPCPAPRAGGPWWCWCRSSLSLSQGIVSALEEEKEDEEEEKSRLLAEGNGDRGGEVGDGEA